jgi:hypothetical protein
MECASEREGGMGESAGPRGAVRCASNSCTYCWSTCTQGEKSASFSERTVRPARFATLDVPLARAIPA